MQSTSKVAENVELHAQNIKDATSSKRPDNSSRYWKGYMTYPFLSKIVHIYFRFLHNYSGDL